MTEKDDLISRIDGLSSENLVTEVLAYILSNDRYVPTQRLFYNYLFDSNHNLSTEDGHFEVATGQRYEEGIPDIIIRSDDSVAIIENKFFAPYSQQDQLYRYFNLLTQDSELAKSRVRVLALLTIRGRMPFYLEEVVQDFSSKIDGIADLDSLQSILLKEGVRFKALEWQEVMRLVKCDDPIADSLSRYIEKNFIGEVRLMEKDITILESQDTAKAFEKVFEIVTKAREQIQVSGYDTKKFKMSQSRDFYGFSISLEGWSIYFGYYRTLWVKYSPYTPLYMQFRMKWMPRSQLTEAEIRGRLLSRFLYDDAEEFVKGYPISKIANFDSFISEVIEDIRFVERSIV